MYVDSMISKTLCTVQNVNATGWIKRCVSAKTIFCSFAYKCSCLLRFHRLDFLHGIFRPTFRFAMHIGPYVVEAFQMMYGKLGVDVWAHPVVMLGCQRGTGSDLERFPEVSNQHCSCTLNYKRYETRRMGGGSFLFTTLK